jgi:hypothetical protein
MRALAIVGGAAFVAACSIGALEGYSGEPLPDAGPTVDATTNPATDSTTDSASTVDGTPTTSAYHAAVAADAPIAHFALEESTGASCASRTTTSAVCVYPSDKLSRGQAGIGGTKAIRFEASTAMLSISGLPGDLAAPYTFELWVMLDGVAPYTDLGGYANTPKPSETNGDGINLFLWENGRLRTETWKSGALIAYGLAPSAPTVAVWHHIVIAHSPGPHTDLFYVDGQLVEHNTNEAAARPLVTSALQIGGFVGFVDELAVYDKTLAPARIAAHYAAQ